MLISYDIRLHCTMTAPLLVCLLLGRWRRQEWFFGTWKKHFLADFTEVTVDSRFYSYASHMLCFFHLLSPSSLEQQ